MASEETDSYIGTKYRNIIKHKRHFIESNKWQLLIDISAHLGTAYEVVHCWIARYRTIEKRVPTLMLTIDRALTKEHTAIELWYKNKSILDDWHISLQANDK